MFAVMRSRGMQVCKRREERGRGREGGNGIGARWRVGGRWGAGEGEGVVRSTVCGSQGQGCDWEWDFGREKELSGTDVALAQAHPQPTTTANLADTVQRLDDSLRRRAAGCGLRPTQTVPRGTARVLKGQGTGGSPRARSQVKSLGGSSSGLTPCGLGIRAKYFTRTE